MGEKQKRDARARDGMKMKCARPFFICRILLSLIMGSSFSSSASKQEEEEKEKPTPEPQEEPAYACSAVLGMGDAGRQLLQAGRQHGPALVMGGVALGYMVYTHTRLDQLAAAVAAANHHHGL